MSYKLKGSLYIPEARPAPLAICQDSAKMISNSGRVVSTLAIPHGYLVRDFSDEAMELLRELGDEEVEFHANKIASWNIGVYQRFLQLVMRGIHMVTDVSTITSLVHVFGADAQDSAEIRGTMDFIDGIWEGEGGRHTEELLIELARQVLWFASYGQDLFPERYRAELHVYIDDEGRLAELIEAIRAYDVFGRGLLMTGSELITKTLGAIRRQVPRYSTIPPIEEWRYLKSETSFGIQAADLISNLFQGAIRCELGDPSQASALRRDLIEELTKFELPEDLEAHVELVPLPDGQQGLRCTKSDLFSHFKLSLGDH